MIDRDTQARNALLVRLSESREELRRLLDPPRAEVGSTEALSPGHSGFPRSRTMQMLMSSRGLGTLGALAGGLLLARPALALRLLRMVPASALAKMFLDRAVSALKARPERDGP